MASCMVSASIYQAIRQRGVYHIANGTLYNTMIPPAFKYGALDLKFNTIRSPRL